MEASNDKDLLTTSDGKHRTTDVAIVDSPYVQCCTWNARELRLIQQNAKQRTNILA